MKRLLPLLLLLAPLLAQNSTDYYFEGQAAANEDYTGDGVLLAGLTAGLFTGFIGWGIGYVMLSYTAIEVPYLGYRDLNEQGRLDYREGYRFTVLKKRSEKFNLGAAYGSAVLLVVYLVTR